MCETEGCFKNIKIGVIGDIDEEERKKIFSLISAAPDLLDACEDAIYVFKSIGSQGETITKLIEAVEKAKGR